MNSIFSDDDGNTFKGIAILLSRMKWYFLHLGAWHCLQYQNESDGNIYCLNDDEFLSVRYITIQDLSGTVLQKLWARVWSVLLVSGRGECDFFDCYVEYFQLKYDTFRTGFISLIAGAHKSLLDCNNSGCKLGRYC